MIRTERGRFALTMPSEEFVVRRFHLYLKGNFLPMTEMQKLKKISDIQRQLADIELKFGRLKIQADRLQVRLEELQKLEVKETKVPTLEERAEQSIRDRQREQKLLQNFVDDGSLDGDLLKMAFRPRTTVTGKKE